VTFAVIILCVASQRVFIVVSVYFVMTQSGNFWIHLRTSPITTFCRFGTYSFEAVVKLKNMNLSNVTTKTIKS
jgi:hypothetical protein